MELIRVTRGEDFADIRPDWLEDWQAQGWEVPGVSDTLDLTREGIAKMPKADVIGLLEAHGVGKPEGSVSDLREQLIGIVFVGGGDA